MARKDAEKICLEWIDMIDPSGINTKRWQTKFSEMSDDDFKAFVNELRNGRDYISVVSPNYGKTKITTENNFKIAKKLGVKLFQRIWLTDPVTNRRYLSNDPYPVFHLPVRRQIQMVKSKMSYAEDNSKTDALTGQPTGISKGGALTYPEVLVLYSRGLTESVKEMIWARGGNAGAFKMMNKKIKDTGSCSLKELQEYSTGVQSTQVLNVYLKAMHIDNNV